MGIDATGGVQRVVQMLLAVVLTVAVLHLGREILLPLAMAILLTFLLSPLVRALERRRMPRVPAVLLVMFTLFAVVIVAGMTIASQFNDLARQLPKYEQNLHDKLSTIRLSEGSLQRLKKVATELSEDVSTESAEQAAAVQPVRIVNGPGLPLDQLQFMVTNLMAPLASAAIVIVLVIFMLINREDMRNRLVRLAGTRFALTTRTLDEVGVRISRYLLMNALVNGGFGIAVAVGLALVGVQYAVVWGFVAAVLRFIPYIGPVLAAVMPVGMAVIQFPGTDWIHPILALAVFLVLELIVNNVIEPLAYGSSTGVSTVALIVAAMFWTWIWGPLGLALAVPLTVVFAVLGEYVTPLEPLAILLGDKPALAGWVSYYQRLLASDVEEAARILTESRSHAPLINVYDSVVIPALVVAQKDRESGELLEPEEQFIWQATQEFMEEWAAEKSAAAGDVDKSSVADLVPVKARVVGCPAHDTADEMILHMLEQGLIVDAEAGYQILPATMLASEMLAMLAEQTPDVVLISSLGFLGGRQSRYLCKRIRQSFPDLQIIVGRWSYSGDLTEMTANMKARGADQVVTTLLDARDALQRVTPMHRQAATGDEASSKGMPNHGSAGDGAANVSPSVAASPIPAPTGETNAAATRSAAAAH